MNKVSVGKIRLRFQNWLYAKNDHRHGNRELGSLGCHDSHLRRHGYHKGRLDRTASIHSHLVIKNSSLYIQGTPRDILLLSLKQKGCATLPIRNPRRGVCHFYQTQSSGFLGFIRTNGWACQFSSHRDVKWQSIFKTTDFSVRDKVVRYSII